MATVCGDGWGWATACGDGEATVYVACRRRANGDDRAIGNGDGGATAIANSRVDPAMANDDADLCDDRDRRSANGRDRSPASGCGRKTCGYAVRANGDRYGWARASEDGACCRRLLDVPTMAAMRGANCLAVRSAVRRASCLQSRHHEMD